MLDAASFASRLRRLAVTAALPSLVAIGTAGCVSTDHSTSTFAWPAGAACPPREEAALYMAEFADSGSCTQLVSVDGPGERTPDGCAYPITTDTDEWCGFPE